jgi:Fe-S cluster biogenesis protein NfuA
MQIKLENTGDDKLINLFLPTAITGNGQALYANRQTPYQAEIITNITALDGVEYALFADNLLAVKFADATTKQNNLPLVLAEADDFFADNSALLTEQNSADDALLLGAVLDSLIRPTLKRDNGDVRIINYSDGVLELEFSGHCAGCPHAQLTLNNLIIRTLKKYIPQLQEVKLKE